MQMPDHSSNPSLVQQLPDEDLLHRFQAEKDQFYLGVLFQRYRHLVFNMSMKYLKSRSESEDMVSYIFTLLLEKLPGKDIHSFKHYLYGTIRNECLSRSRQQRREMERQEAFFHVSEKKSFFFMENDGLLHLINEPSIEELVHEAMTDLVSEQRECIQQFFFEGKSYKEIADLTGFPINKVKSYLQNGKRNLRIWLEARMSGSIN
ncbi:MAG: sigma-70 family RNA polymerase sigma factor [Saprospiraceae bacterium]|nr:sigma-70 family RNA polymerase sigma factor [Saprospiraceae bacterium]